MVAMLVNDLAITVLSIILPVQLIMMALGVMVGIGVSSVISRALGKGNKEDAISALGNGIIFKEIKTFDKLILEPVSIVV